MKSHRGLRRIVPGRAGLTLQSHHNVVQEWAILRHESREVHALHQSEMAAIAKFYQEPVATTSQEQAIIQQVFVRTRRNDVARWRDHASSGARRRVESRADLHLDCWGCECLRQS